MGMGSRVYKTAETRNRRIAVTGGIGCGKTAVASILIKNHIPTLDADDVARDVLIPSHPTGCRVLRAFGPEILKTDGTFDRARLAHLVFRSDANLKKLNQIMHPTILQICRKWMTTHRDRRSAVVLPLLHELGLEGQWDTVLCVIASRDLVIKRLRDRGWTRAEALRRMRSQLSLREKAARSTHVIRNNGTLRELERSVQIALGLR